MNNHIKILDIFYGNKCNLACKQCDVRSDYIQDSTNDPSMDEIKEGIVLANEKFNVENWSVLGGEPFVNIERVIEILKFVRSIEPTKTIFFPTNGFLLGKNIDLAVELIKEYKVWIQVSDHFISFNNKQLSNKVKNSIEQVVAKLNLPRTNEWRKGLLTNNNNVPGWQAFVERKGLVVSDDFFTEHAWGDKSGGISYLESPQFQSNHYYDANRKPKPFNSTDPAMSYWNSCPGHFCAFLHNKKIYKCAALGTLKTLLTLTDSLDDKEWQPYLNYKPVDLMSCTDKEIEEFSNTHFCHIDECAMCPNNTVGIVKTEEKVLPIYFKNEHR